MIHFCRYRLPVFLFLVVIGVENGLAQTQAPGVPHLLKTSQMKGNLNFVGIDVSFEQKIAKDFTSYFEGGINYGYYKNGGMINFARGRWNAIAPFLSAGLRWYYNLERRYNKGANILNNAANFFRIKGRYRFEAFEHRGFFADPVLTLMPAWGIQRNIGQHFNFEVAPGYEIVYNTRHKDWSSHVAFNLKLGYIIF